MYNRVNVTLQNKEFADVTSKEVELAQYLDMIHSISLEEMVAQDTLELSGAHQSIASVRNNQNAKTTIHLDEQKFGLLA